MKVVILAGGYGTRLSEETGLRPKPKESTYYNIFVLG
jgi:dTDP-glucose pyrophosphorylase